MQTLNTIPCEDGYNMPGEFEKHSGCIMIWPVRPGSWTSGGRDAQITFSEIARAIAKSEKVYMLAGNDYFERVKQNFESDRNIEVLNIETDDAWARDVGPTFLIDAKKRNKVRGVSWRFNAWGGNYNGLYPDYEKDDEAALKICDKLDVDCYDAGHFVLEGGSIHSDGEGTILVTEACLLSKGRNPKLSKNDIENELKKYLGACKVIWLPRGIFGDETDEHVDNVCSFARPGEVILAWTDDKSDPQWQLSNLTYDVLSREKDAKGRSFIIHKLPIPQNPVCITKEEIETMEFAEGEDIRMPGERLAASYVNFYISNDAVILPQFGDENDKKAVRIISEIFKEREVIPINTRSVIVGGGNIHCITQQIPMG